ncbi:MAG: 30S ribosomal protein S21 [Candidatus Theseobacter exili]|nr:30S ribosomal protein S21 [Candidatus Theseobacter exili]
MSVVFVKRDQDITRALRVFKKKCMRDGIMKYFKRAQRFEKPSERKRREKLRSIKKVQKIINVGPTFGRKKLQKPVR